MYVKGAAWGDKPTENYQQIYCFGFPSHNFTVLIHRSFKCCSSFFQQNCSTALLTSCVGCSTHTTDICKGSVHRDNAWLLTEDALFLLPSQKGRAGKPTEKRKGQTGSQVKREGQSEQEVNRKEKEVKTGSQEKREGQSNQEVRWKEKDSPKRKSREKSRTGQTGSQECQQQ